MKSKKLKLEELVIQSFVTDLKENKANTIKGGSLFNCADKDKGTDESNNPDAGCLTESNFIL